MDDGHVSAYALYIWQIDVSFSCACSVINNDFRDNIVKVAVNPRGDSRMASQTTLTVLSGRSKE